MTKPWIQGHLASDTMSVDVAVVGSINQDLTVMTKRHPRPGETIIGRGHFHGPGGKGANQAVAAARQGVTVAMLGRVGDDDSGRSMIANLESEDVDTSWIGLDADRPTGLAVITLDDEGENSIVVSPGANEGFDPDQLDRGFIRSATVVLAQCEVPIEVVVAAAQLADGWFCLNPAPANHLSAELLQLTDVLIPNQVELAALVGVDHLSTIAEVSEAALSIDGPKAVIVTMGGAGSMLVAGTATHLPAMPVDPIDTTGAGDAFCGVLAAALASGAHLEQATRRAMVAGAIATTRRGAQSALPTAADIDRALEDL